MDTVNTTQTRHVRHDAPLPGMPAPVRSTALSSELTLTGNPRCAGELPTPMAGGLPSCLHFAANPENHCTLPAPAPAPAQKQRHKQKQELLRQLCEYFSWRTAVRQFCAEWTRNPEAITELPKLEKAILRCSITWRLEDAGEDIAGLDESIDGLVDKMRAACPVLDFMKVVDGLLKQIKQSHDTPQTVIERFRLKPYERAAFHQQASPCRPSHKEQVMEAALFLLDSCLSHQSYRVGTHQ